MVFADRDIDAWFETGEAGVPPSGRMHSLSDGFAFVGFGNSNIFSIVFSQAILAVPEKQNEVSGLMIMGLFGGTVFPLLMGFASDAVGQAGAVAVMAVGVAYLLYYMTTMHK